MTTDLDEPKLSEEMAALQRRLREIQMKLEGRDCSTPPRMISSIPAPTYTSYARSMVVAQRRLSRYFDFELFCSPVFHMMLEIFAASEEQKTLTVDEACKISAVSPGTAQRWLTVMEAEKLIRRLPEKGSDKAAVALTPAAANRLRAWLAETASVPLRREWQE